MDLPYEEPPLAMPEISWRFYTFQQTRPFYDSVKGNLHRVLTVAKAWHYLIVMKISLQLPAGYFQLHRETAVDPLRAPAKAVTVE